MNLKSQKAMAAKILKSGVSRIKVENDPDVAEAITRNDIRELIRSGLISAVPKKGQCKSSSRKKSLQKKKGRKMSKGSKKGTKKARKNPKVKWMEKIRPIRRLLKGMKEGAQLNNADYKKLYKLSSGGTFRSKKHILMYAADHDMLKGSKPRKNKTSIANTKTDSEPKKTKPQTKSTATKTASPKKKPSAAKKVKKDA
ncbi:MAG: 50S ribosomal protein L19e [Candidatus Aenigmarchaeota archaeon]|nr:50S ribosomal protein L19e [Candidatus Aenigmarchaeota archaeon]